MGGTRRTQLRQRRAGLLRERGQVRVGVAGHGPAGDDLHGLGDGLDLLSAELLPGLEVRSLLLACRGQVGKVLLIRLLGRGGVREVTLGVGLGLQLLRLDLGLLLAVLRGLIDLRREVLHQHVVGVLGVHLLLLQGRALIDELVEELLEHLDDTMGLELVAMGFRCGDLQALRVLGCLQEQIQGLLGLRGDEVQAHEVGHLSEGGLGAVVGLFLQHRDCSLNCVDRF
mmetsp:Transcript_73049/g.205763  ORF Transcript_73049/g.205763 Transcript_73049/m.205763 type:complete len:227 (+) Transcript_73049:152-832(+)